jgi:hypothetical protein
MALLAPIQVRRPNELTIMDVLVAVDTLGVLHLEQCLSTRWNVAGIAAYGVMFSAKRKARVQVIRSGERRWLEALDRVATFASPAIRPGGELAIVWIRLMAVRTSLESNCLLEVSTLVATLALNLRMLANQGELGLRMVEVNGRGRLLPALRGVARFAALLEASAMRIGMAGSAVLKLQTDILDRAVKTRLMAELTRHLTMCAGQPIVSLGMVEGLGGFPRGRTVALQAVRSQLTLVHVNVATRAVRG